VSLQTRTEFSTFTSARLGFSSLVFSLTVLPSNVPGVLRDLNKTLEIYNVSQQHLSTTKHIGYAIIDVDKVDCSSVASFAHC